MRAEVLLVEQTFGETTKDGGVRAEIQAWCHLFRKKYIKRTLIGIMMMFFQRQCATYLITQERCLHSSRMEWNQCLFVLRTNPHAFAWPAWGYNLLASVRWRWGRSVLCSTPCYLVY